MLKLASLWIPLLLLLAGEAVAARVRIVVETPAGLPQNVYLSRPVGLGADRPIVLALHGEQRDAARYCDALSDLAVEHQVMVVVPEFSERNFPGAAGFEEGNVMTADGGVRPRSEWAFSVIEPIFDAVREHFSMTTPGYGIFGRSAGARFVQRFLLLEPDARVRRAVVLEAGAYTLPDFNLEYPRGLRGTAADELTLRKALTLPVAILLVRAEGNLESAAAAGQAPGAAAAMEAGQSYYAMARRTADRLGVTLAWQLQLLPPPARGSSTLDSTAIAGLLP
jgi:pimeloyl-ACP methyl ester carboxylesterase